MKRQRLCMALLAAALLLTGCGQAQLAARVESALEQAGPLPTVSPSPEAESLALTATASPTVSPKVSARPSAAPTPRPTATPAPTASLMPSPSPSPSPTPVPSPSPTPSSSPTPTPEPSFTPYPQWMMAPIPQSIPYLTPSPTPVPTPTPTPSPSPTPSAASPSPTPESYDAQEHSATYDKGVELALFALEYVGYDYKWGGKDPEEGFDCSGFVYYVYQQFGYELSRVASDQAKDGTAVDIHQLEPGDVLGFYHGSSIGHSGIYIGNGEYVHSQDSATGVTVSYLSDRSGGFVARRILE